MNTEQLHAIAIATIEDINTTSSLKILEQLVKSLENSVKQPQSPELQNQIAQHLKTLYDALAKSKTNNYSPGWKQVLKELGVHDLLGNSLLESIREIFERNQITPAAALQELQELRSQLSIYKTSFEQVINSFANLKIGLQEIEKGHCEVGILIPRLAVSDNLRDFSRDLNRLDNLLGTFSELTTKQRPGFKMSSISSTDFNIMLATIPITAASIAFAVDRILTVYKRILEIRKLHGELKKLGFENKELANIKKKAESAITEEIEKLTPELLEKYCTEENAHRRNELSIALDQALWEIAKRIDKGYNVEIRVPSDQTEGDSKDVHINTITSVIKNLEYIKLEGEPVLSLPETTEENNEDDTHEDRTP